MKILFLNTPFTFSLVPRILPTSNVTVILRNEMTGILITETLPFTFLKGKIYITLSSNSDFTTQNKYEVEVKELDKTIYRGKLMILEENTDVQNYTQETQTNKMYAYTE